MWWFDFPKTTDFKYGSKSKVTRQLQITELTNDLSISRRSLQTQELHELKHCCPSHILLAIWIEIFWNFPSCLQNISFTYNRNILANYQSVISSPSYLYLCVIRCRIVNSNFTLWKLQQKFASFYVNGTGVSKLV